VAIAVKTNTLKNDAHQEIATQVAAILKDIRFGSVEIVIHDGRVVQIDKRERFRINENK
jgi:hypothetical protein